MKKNVIAVVGTTGSGKSHLAIQLAQKFNGEILSIDSRQIYKDMNIGTNKEPGEVIQKDQVPNAQPKFDNPVSISDILNNPYIVEDTPHYFIDVLTPDKVLTLAHVQELAFETIDFIQAQGKIPILVGGTSLYASAILDNWLIPDVQPDQDFRDELKDLSNEEMLQRLVELDRKTAEKIDFNNRHRLQRALEIAMNDGIKPGKPKKQNPRYNVLYLAPKVDREELYEKINKRVDQMMNQGWIEEVKSVGEKYGWDTVAMTGIGYRQLAEVINNGADLDKTVEQIKQATRKYAKRQLTWWRKYGDVHWTSSAQEAQSLTETFLANQKDA